MIDGQDSNDPSVTGRQQPINNTDIVQEIRLITNQFAAEYGRAAGSVMNVVTKSGTNTFHGSAFWLSQRRTAELAEQPRQGGRPHGGAVPQREPVWRHPRRPRVRDQTFFFGSYPALDGSPPGLGLHAERRAHRRGPRSAPVGRRQPAAGAGAAQVSCRPRSAERQDRRPSPSAARPTPFRSARSPARVAVLRQQPVSGADRPSAHAEPHPDRPLPAERHADDDTGTGQVTPPGLTTSSPANQHSLNVWLTSIFSATRRTSCASPGRTSGPITDPDRPGVAGDPVHRDHRAGPDGFNAGPTARPSAWP